MGKMSRDKGKVGEREVVHLLKDHGIEARRGQQFCGASGDPDVVTDGLHIEVKRRERLNIEEAMQQARADAREGTIPTVWHRRNGEKWKVTLDAENFIDLWKEARK